MKPGIYPDIPNEAYHRNPAYKGLSKSLISEFLKSPLHCFAKMVEPSEPTPAMIFGTLFHTMVLEPKKFDKKVKVWDGGRKAGKAWTAFKEEHAGRTIISPDDFDKLLRMRHSIIDNPTAKALLTGGTAEESFVWEDERGFTCKCRTDYRKESLEIVIDLKTAVDASPEGFSRASANFGYDIQAAFYLAGVNRVTGGNYRDFIFIVVEKNFPYAAAVYRASQEMCDSGRAKIRPMLDDYAECVRSGIWPGYTDEGISDLYLPKWAA